MNGLRERIERLSPKQLTLLALELQARLDALEQERSEPLAVIGIGCRLPRAGRGAQPFWNLLLAGGDAVSQVPHDRWDAAAWYDSDPDSPGRASTTWGSFVSDVNLFDAPFFNISAREAAAMDPQQRILLETSWEALEDAGRSPRSLQGTATGVFIGLTNNDYHAMLLGRGEAFLDTYVATGASPSVAAGRISYALGLHGPSIALDTACSGSLVAIHLACQSLRRAECSMALAGGVNLILSPDVTVALSKAHMMAPDGHSKTFDARANGFVRGEGCGMVVLKRFSDAQRDGDHILALIRGSAVNQDGRSSGLTAPNGAAQEALLRQALADARLSPDDIDYIEAHGTGTALGDPIEAHALAAVFGPSRDSALPLVVGSVKTNLGHLEAAAGVAGLLKTLLALQHQHIPRHLHFRSLNPHIDWSSLRVEIPVEGRPWPRGERVRRAGVSSFGFSGTNAHVILEEAPAPVPRQAEWQRDWHILALSARTPGGVTALSEQYRRALAETSVEVGDFCFTANAGRTHFEERTFFTGRNREQILEQMKQPQPSGRKEGSSVGVAFVFSAEGGPYPGMGRELYRSQPVFHRALDECAAMLQGELGEPLGEILWGARTDLLGQRGYTEAAMFAVEYALAEVWRSWGIEPAVAAGEGVGEYVAACVAGVYGLEAALKLSVARGRLQPAALAEAVAAQPCQAARVKRISGATRARLMELLEAEPAAIQLELGPAACSGWEPLLESLGTLYVRGAEVDWDGFDRGYARRRIPLPTYPFERHPYWADIPRRLPEMPASEPPADWFYQVVWEPKPAAGQAGPTALAGAADFHLLETTAARLRLESGFDQYDQLCPLLDRLCAALIVGALRRLGYEFAPGMEFIPAVLAQTLGIAGQHLRLFDRLVAILSDEGIIQGDGAGRFMVREADLADPVREFHALETQFTPFRAEIEMLRRCGDALPEVLSGRIDPLQMLFSEGSFESAEKLYTESPGLRVFNGLAASAIAEEIRRRPGRTLRILEVGAGTGATTSWIASVLPSGRAEYSFTDISTAFITRAQSRFQHYPFFQFRPLDIERDPRSQGFLPGRFDIVIAANVVHATADLGVTMRHIRELLAPSGLVLLIEGIRPERWVDLTFGLTEGWWRFRDRDLRPSYPLLSQASWMDLLAATGFHGAGAVRAGDSQVALILARALHAGIAQRWLVVPDQTGVAGQFASLLGDVGGSVQMAGGEKSVDLLRTERFDGVLYLAALDCSSAGDLSDAGLCDAIDNRSSEILHLTRSCAARGIRLWLVTCGAQPVLQDEHPINFAQATVWGWAKTISLEHPGIAGGVIDLDPAAQSRENAIALADTILGGVDDLEDQLAIRDGMRYAPRLRHAPAPGAVAQTLSKDKLYLITGGLGGLGLRLARWMAQRGARRLLLVSRTGLPDCAIWDQIPAHTVVGRRIAAVREIEHFGAEVIAKAVDISNARQAEDLFASLPGELGGIFHLAAAGEMSPLGTMTSAGMREVLAPKTHGTWHLHRLSKALPLDFFVLFSSWSSVLGAQDLAHYNAANQFLDGLAHYRASLSLPATSVNWGAWDVIRNASDGLRSEYERSGLRSMASDVAFTAMHRSATETQAIVADVDWPKLKALYEVRRPRPLLEFAVDRPGADSTTWSDERANAPAANSRQNRTESAHSDIRAQIVGCPASERHRRLEAYVTSVLASVTGIPDQQLPPGTPTDELGLDSLMALEARNRINSELEISIPAVRFLQGLTITDLASKIADELPTESSEKADDPLAAQIGSSGPVDESFALSFAQRAYWLVQRIVPDSFSLNCGFTATASPSLKFDAFEQAVWRLMERHAALRSIIFETEEGEPAQRVRTSWQAETTLIDATGLTDPELADLVTREFRRAFEVQKSVFRIPVFRRNECDVLLFVFHHLVVDGSSVPLCFRELREIYTAELAGRSPQLPPAGASYREFVDWELELVNGSGIQRLWDFWKRELSGDLPILSLPLSRPRPATFLPRGKRVFLEIDRDLARCVHDAARQSKTTTFSFLLTAFQILLCFYGEQDDLMLGTSSSTRDLAKWENTVGSLVNLFPIRCRLSREATFAEQLARTRETVLKALDHQGIPFPLLVERLRIRRDVGCPPLFQGFFNYLTARPGSLGRFLLGIPDASVPFGDSIMTPWIDIKHEEVQSDVMLYLADLGDEIYAYLNYNADVVDEFVAQGLAADYPTILRSVVADPNAPISLLPITAFWRDETDCEELIL